MPTTITKVAKFLSVIALLLVFMGANEGGCIEGEVRPIDPDDPGEPGGDPDDPGEPGGDPDDPGVPDEPCGEMFEVCVGSEGEEGDCELILDHCEPIEPPPSHCEDDYEVCLLDAEMFGFDPAECEFILEGCYPVNPCEEDYYLCLEEAEMFGFDPAECEFLLEGCYPVDPCDEMLDECLMSGQPEEICFEEYEFCHGGGPGLPCEDMYERCIEDHPFPWECEVILIYCEPEPDPCEDAFLECDMMFERCIEEPWMGCEDPEGCDDFIDPDYCYMELEMCYEEAAWRCEPEPEPDPCEDAFLECDMMLERCIEEPWMGCEDPEDCDDFIDPDYCYMEVEMCYEEAARRCEPEPEPDPCEDAILECEMMFERCMEDPWLACEDPEGCEDFIDPDHCYIELEMCYEDAFWRCEPEPEPDPCEWVIELCESEEVSREECETLLSECWTEPEPWL